MKKILQKIIRRLKTRRVGNLVIGTDVKFENKGKITSGISSYLGSINNLTVRIKYR